MNLQQAKILLEKINSLYKSMSMDKDHVASIERDLMLSYVRQLYESFLDLEATSAKTAPPPPAAKKTPPKPRIIEIPDSLREVEAEPEPKPKPQPKPTPPPPPKPAPKAESSADPGNFELLFEHKQARELSEKLSERPINDLTKAFAINDRLLYTNELFGKDQNAFLESLKLLNKFEGMDEAKSLLLNLAEQYEWTDEEKLDSARSFIKIVRRRYVS